MQHPESKILNEYVMHMCESGWADEEATTEQGKAFLFRGNLVDDHLTFFFGLSQDEVSTLSDARGAIARMGPGIAIELYGDATVLEEQWRKFAR